MTTGTAPKTVAAVVVAPIEIPDDATLVHIAVKPVNGGYRLGVFPSRRGETKAFYTEPGQEDLRSPERPREVVWVAHGLPNDMKLVIQAKPKVQGLGLLVQDEYTINAPDRLVASQPVLKEGTWSYNIFLRSTASGNQGKLFARVDPDIDIHPEP